VLEILLTVSTAYPAHVFTRLAGAEHMIRTGLASITSPLEIVHNIEYNALGWNPPGLTG
jgi:hypothetical protein